MIPALTKLLSATLATVFLISATCLEPMAGCTAYWYVYWVGPTKYVRVGCQADTACPFPNHCKEAITQSGSNMEMACTCPNMTQPLCKARFFWPGNSESDIPRHDTYYVDPADWTCINGQCTKTCQKETQVDENLPAGSDTPCNCPP